MRNFLSKLTVFIIIVLLVGCSRQVSSPSVPAAAANRLQSSDDLKDKRLGVLLGSIYDKYAQNSFPEAKILQYQTVSDLILAVNSKKVDAAFFPSMALKEIMKVNADFGILTEDLFFVSIGAGFNKENTGLREQFNAFLKEIKSNGIYDEMYDRWIGDAAPVMPAIEGDSSNGVLNVGLAADIGLPNIAIQNGELIGFDAELAKRFAAWLGKAFAPADMPFGSLIASISTKKIDIVVSSMTINEERKKQIDFSDPYLEAGASIVVLKENMAESTPATMSKLDDIADKRIGIFSGTVHDAFVAQKYPKAKLFRYDGTADMILSLKTGKIDVAMFDAITAGLILKRNPDLGLLTDNVFDMPLGVGFNKKNAALRDEFNDFLREIRKNGVYDEMHKRWFIDDAEEAEMPLVPNPRSEKKLVAAVSVEDLPYVAFMNNEYVGFDIEMIRRFAEYANYHLEIVRVEFPSLIAALDAGKADLIADGIGISEERAKQIDFSDSYADFRTAVIAAKKNLAGFQDEQAPATRISFLESISNSFYNNIILESRYLLIIDGLKITILVSVLAALFGTSVGGLICFMRMSKNKAVSIVASLYISLVRGTPVLVLLMIIFYVIFASVNINPVIVAVIAFGINFGAYVSEMFRTSIESIDRGQYEAGIAGGFTKVQTFVHIVMPQALRRVLPVYKGEFISLVKMTSIVGYIAVQDLTKASDIIRSRTFDAFFPLIMAAVLYIVIAGLFTWALSYVEISVDPKRKRTKNEMEAGLT